MNGDGGIGDGTTLTRLVPVPVAGGRQFLHVSAGAGTTCAVGYSDYRVYCWGRNHIGQLGNGTTTRALTPVPIASSRQFRLVEVGPHHVCAVTTDNRAFCWAGTNSAS